MRRALRSANNLCFARREALEVRFEVSSSVGPVVVWFWSTFGAVFGASPCLVSGPFLELHGK